MNKKSKSNWKPWAKGIGIVIAVVAIILILIQIYFSFFAESDLKNKIETAISKSDNQLTVDVGNLNLNTLQRQMQIENITIRRDTAIQSDSLKKSAFSIDSLIIGDITINGAHIFSYLSNEKVIINDISINKPRLYATKSSASSQDSSSKDSASMNAKIYDKIKSFAKTLAVGQFSINKLNTDIKDTGSASSLIKADNLSLQLSNIRVDSAWAKKDSTLPIEAFEGYLDSLSYSVDPKLYDLKLKNLSFSSRDSSFTTDSIAVIPKLPKYEFSQSVGHQTDRIDLKINTLNVKGLDFSAFAENQKLIATSLNITDTNLDVFHNKKLPSGKKTKKTFYHLKFRQMNTPVKLDSVVVKNADIRYSEHKENIPNPGYVAFENINASIQNLDNTISINSPEAKPIKMKAETDIMGVGRLNADFKFPPNNTGTHYVSGSVSRMPITALNPALKNLASTNIESGLIHSLDFEMELGPQNSTGTLKLHYTDLEVKMIEFEGENETDDKWLKSFIANKIVIKGDNTPPLREGEISFERIEEKSIFNYWWKSLLSGLKSSVGL